MKVTYEFTFDESRKEAFELEFNEKNMSINPLPVGENEAWIQLEFHQCPDCPLKKDSSPYCPVARNLLPVLTRFRDDPSYIKVHTTVTMEARTVERHGSLQEGAYPLLGLIMATSGCPVLDRFKPMAFTHLPFANEDETLMRAVSNYLLAQYIRMQHDKKPDWDLVGFEPMYARVEKINGAFIERFRDLSGRDANVNALLLLNIFAQLGSFSLNTNWMDKIIPFFSAYLEE